jgi:hypothetical protein
VPSGHSAWPPSWRNWPWWANAVQRASTTSSVRPKGRHRRGGPLHSWGGTITHGGQTIRLKPGMLVYVPVGVAHGIKAEGGELTLVDFAQPPFDPQQMEWIK